MKKKALTTEELTTVSMMPELAKHVPAMSTYPGEKPYNGTITEKQWRQLQLMPELVTALEDTLYELISYKQNYDATPNWPNPENDSETVQQAREVLAKAKGGKLALTCDDIDEQGADARLIAAAPDLLEALEGLHKALSRMIDKHDPDSIEAEWLQHSHEAILKAKGGKP